MSVDAEAPPLAREALENPADEKQGNVRTRRLLLPRIHRREPGQDAADGPLSRWVLAVIGASFLGVSFAQSPGLIEFDTKLPLSVSPISYFDSLLRLWNPSTFGGVVAQGVGFLMPQGLFNAVGYVLHIPVWVTERLWLATLLTVGCWGLIRLAEALGIGNRWARVIAGVAYCVAPIVVTWISTSGDLLAVMLLPWLLTPLVHGSKEGSTRRAAARSGVAFALMGGANGAVVVATLPVALIWLMTRTSGPRRRSLALWWVVAIGMACFWWVGALACLNHFGYNYLPFTETSAVTTSTASAFESIRGASFWINYFNLGGPYLRGAWILVSIPAVIVGTATVSALGLAGLCRRIPERLFLVTSLVFGVVVIMAGYPGAWGGPFSHTAQHLLQHQLAAFRNVSKFSPDVALPIALGLAWTLSAQRGSVRRSVTRLVPSRAVLRVIVTVVAVAAVFLAAAPFLRGELYRSGGFTAIPSYWQKAGAFLNEHQGHENAVLVPGSNEFGDYTWGDPIDEPLEIVASTALEWRDVVPLGSNGYNQMMSAIEQALDNGTPTAGLAQFLSRRHRLRRRAQRPESKDHGRTTPGAGASGAVGDPRADRGRVLRALPPGHTGRARRASCLRLQRVLAAPAREHLSGRRHVVGRADLPRGRPGRRQRRRELRHALVR